MNTVIIFNQSILGLIPQHWFTKPSESAVWVSGYRILRADKEGLKLAGIFDYEKLRVIIGYGQIQYFDASAVKPEISHDGNVVLRNGAKEIRTTELGWLVIVQPYVVNGIEQAEQYVRNRAGMYAGLYAAVNGRNMAFERVFDNTVRLKDGQITVSSDSWVTPKAFPVPDIARKRLDEIHMVGKILESKTGKERQRFEQSLHWFESGMRDPNPLDGFIKYWIALETLGMPDTTDIRPLNESLARGYGAGIDDVKSKFGIGKIFGFRSRILHDGDNLPIHQSLSEYMEALFLDVLFAHLGVSSAQKAAKILERPGFNLDLLLHIR